MGTGHIWQSQIYLDFHFEQFKHAICLSYYLCLRNLHFKSYWFLKWITIVWNSRLLMSRLSLHCMSLNQLYCFKRNMHVMCQQLRTCKRKMQYNLWGWGFWPRGGLRWFKQQQFRWMLIKLSSRIWVSMHYCVSIYLLYSLRRQYSNGCRAMWRWESNSKRWVLKLHNWPRMAVLFNSL